MLINIIRHKTRKFYFLDVLNSMYFLVLSSLFHSECDVTQWLLGKVEIGSLALVDFSFFCRIFGSSWFQSFNVFGVKLSLKVSVRALDTIT